MEEEVQYESRKKRLRIIALFAVLALIFLTLIIGAGIDYYYFSDHSVGNKTGVNDTNLINDSDNPGGDYGGDDDNGQDFPGDEGDDDHGGGPGGGGPGGGGPGGGGGCTPTLTCANYLGQCGQFINGCPGGTIDCTCAEGLYCYTGEGVKDVCINNSVNCTDSDNKNYFNKGNVSLLDIFYDSCLDSKNLTEHYCYYNGTRFEVRNETHFCEENCSNGICLGGCTQNLTNASWSGWQNQGSCRSDDLQLRNQSKVEYDSNKCGTFANKIYWNYTNVSCNYCSYSAVNTTWTEWANISCLASGFMNQTRSKTEYDQNYSTCYAVTRLASDLWNSGNNKTYREYRNTVSCPPSCNLNLVNTSWSAWTNVSCLSSGLMNQSRYKTQYDSNKCGTFANKSYFEYRQTLGCRTCVPKSCTNLGFGCGAQKDNCGNAIECGSCAAGEYCQQGICVEPEAPVDCSEVSCFYVSESGAGSKTGIDWNNAYAGIPDVLQRGATYFLADGNYPGYAFDDAEDGNKYITVKKANDADHGTDVGWQTSFGDGRAYFTSQLKEILEFITGYYILDGSTGGGPGKWMSGFGFDIKGTRANQSCIGIKGPGDYNKEVPDFITLRHCEIHHRGMYTDSQDVGIESTIVQDPSEKSENITVEYNYIHTFGLTNIWTGFGNNWLVQYNYIQNDSSGAGTCLNISDDNMNDAWGTCKLTFFNESAPRKCNLLATSECKTGCPCQHGGGWVEYGSRNFIVRYNVLDGLRGTANIDMKKNSPTPEENWSIYGNVFFRSPEAGLFSCCGPGVICATSTGYVNTTISFHDNYPNPDTIEDATGVFDRPVVGGVGYINPKFKTILVYGSEFNDRYYTIQSYNGTTITLSLESSLVNEAAGKKVRLGTGYTSNIKVYNNDFINLYGSNVGFYIPLGINNSGYNNMFYNNSVGNLVFTNFEDNSNWFSNNTNRETHSLMDKTFVAAGKNAERGTGDPFIDWQNLNFGLNNPTQPGVVYDWMDNRDMFGNIRGEDGNWDRGAIEYNENDADSSGSSSGSSSSGGAGSSTSKSLPTFWQQIAGMFKSFLALFSQEKITGSFVVGNQTNY